MVHRSLLEDWLSVNEESSFRIVFFQEDLVTLFAQQRVLLLDAAGKIWVSFQTVHKIKQGFSCEMWGLGEGKIMWQMTDNKILEVISRT